MAACVPITEEKIRAEFWMGDTLIAKTPYILSFNVNKSRTQTSNTFSITMELLAGITFPLGENIRIRAGVRGNLQDIFSGKIEQTRVEPSFGKPSYFRVSLSGSGVLADLEGKTFTRRLRTDGQGLYCLITGGPSNRPDAYNSLDVRKDSGNRQWLGASFDPLKQFSAAEHSPLIVNSGAVGGKGGATNIGAAATEPKDSQSRTTGTGFRVHTHESLDEGGPAFGTYSAD